MSTICAINALQNLHRAIKGTTVYHGKEEKKREKREWVVLKKGRISYLHT